MLLVLRMFTEDTLMSIDFLENNPNLQHHLGHFDMRMELFSKLGAMTCYKAGMKLLRKYDVLNHLKSWVPNKKYYLVLAHFLLSAQVKKKEVLALLDYILKNGSLQLKLISMNVLELLMQDE